MDLFIETIRNRIIDKNPVMTQDDFDALLMLLPKLQQKQLSIVGYYPQQFDISDKVLFLCRRSKEEPLPYPIPNYKIFLETCNGVYDDYKRTLLNILNMDYIQDDIETLKNCIKDNKPHTIICWSNTSIILAQALQELDVCSTLKNVYTFGSPILLPTTTYQCLNIYHEDDWILPLPEYMFVKDYELCDKICTYEDKNKDIYKYLKISREQFLEKSIEPHDSYYILFS